MNNPSITTERLLLRPVQLDDAHALFQYRSNKLANKYQSFIPEKLEEVTDFIQNRVAPEIDKEGTWFQLVMVRQDSNEVIGDIGLHFITGDRFQVEFGCTLKEEEHHKGYAAEALKHTIAYLFNTLKKHRIIASIDPRNTASIKMVERLGMRKEAHFIKSLWFNNEWVDDLVYGLLREEYQSSTSRK